MGRELKFRAWDKDKKQMLPVSDISFGDDGRALTVVFQTAPKGNYYRGLVDGENGILMPFTGLKDRNGKDIYEGDIVKTDGDMKPVPVIFEDGAFQLAGIGYYLNKARVSEWLVEVVGNIYESP